MKSRSSGQPKKRRKDTFFPTLYPLFPVIFATATVVTFVLLSNSRFNFHCYTQLEATPTQKSAWKRPLATSCAKDYEGHSLVQTSFTEPPNRDTSERALFLRRHSALKKKKYIYISVKPTGQALKEPQDR